jgi:hypothetical protein
MYDRGVIALMTFPTVEAAAEHVGVTRQTIFAWLKDPEFIAKLDETRRMALGHAAIMLSAAAGTAISTLLAIAGDDKQPASARVSAATALANLIEKHSHAEREATEQQRRIESLRRALDEARRDNGLDGTPALPSRTT